MVVGGGGLLFAAGMAVLAVRFLLSLQPMQEFLAAYPGEYPLPEGAPVGIPPWLGWQHFFNAFLIVLIIRSGLQVRTEKRPSVFWSPRNNGKRKISLNLWFHQSLDILWITNGLIFIVLLFVTGQWMKIVPTSWAVFPNAISAAPAVRVAGLADRERLGQLQLACSSSPTSPPCSSRPRSRSPPACACRGSGRRTPRP